MPAKPDQQPERHKTIQERYDEAQQRYNVSRAVIDRPDVPPTGKLLLALAGSTTLGIVPLGISKAEPVAFAAVLVCSLAIALLIYRLPDPRPKKRPGRNWTRPLEPRSRRAHKRQFRDTS